MAVHKKKSSLSRAIINLLFVIPALFSLIAKVIALIGLEARLAGKSILNIVLLIVIFGVVFTSTWLCVLVMVFVYLTSFLHWNMELSLFTLIIINLIIMLFLGMIMNKFKKRLSFTATRAQIRLASKKYSTD